MPGIEKRGKFCHKRIRHPNKFSKGSFRTITLSKGTKAVIGCPKGQFRRGRCTVGTSIQKILKKPLRSGKCPRF